DRLDGILVDVHRVVRASADLECELGRADAPTEDLLRRVFVHEVGLADEVRAPPQRGVAAQIVLLESRGPLSKSSDRRCAIAIGRESRSPAPQVFDLLGPGELLLAAGGVIEVEALG